MIKFTTAGESHGKALVAIVEGLPAAIPVSEEYVNDELRRRMQGYGRGARMKIESDQIEFLSGVRAGETIGSPVAMLIRNRDWENWSDIMDPAEREGETGLRRRALKRPRPGHADLVGVLKYDRTDARDVLERASARETAARTAAGSLCRRMLEELGMTIGSHILAIGSETVGTIERPLDINSVSDSSPVRCLDEEVSQRMVKLIDRAKSEGDTLGGVAEVVARGVPVGLGSHVSWDRKLDGRIARAMMSIPAVKGVEIGIGFESARLAGSEVHDEIEPGADEDTRRGGYRRRSNRAGGLEGGITTGEDVVVRVAMKPIATLRKPLDSINLETGEPARAQSERSDVTAVPAMGVIAEAMLAFVLADAVVEKFGGDSLSDILTGFEHYLQRLAR